MAAFNEKKYKKIFEQRYGKGSYDAGINQARSIGSMQTQAKFAKKDYLSELRRAQNEAKKRAEEAVEIYDETASATQKDIEQSKGNKPKSLAYANKQLRLMDPEAAQEIAVQKAKEARKEANKKPSKSKKKKEKEGPNPYVDPDTMHYYKQQESLDDFFQRLDKISTSRSKKDRSAGESFLKKNPRLVKEYERMGGKKMMPTAKDYSEQKRIYEATKAYDAKQKKKKSKKKKDSERSGLLGALDKTLGRASKSASEIVFGKEFVNKQEKEYKKHTKNKQIKAMNKNISKKATTKTEKAADIVGKGLGIASYALPGVAAESGASKLMNLGKLTKPGSKLAANLAVKGTDKGFKALSKNATRYGAKGAAAGAILGTGDAALKETFSPGDRNFKDHMKMIGLETAGGAVLDPAIRGIGALGLKALSKRAKGSSTVGSDDFLPRLAPLQNSKTSSTEALFNQLADVRKQPPVAATKEGLEGLGLPPLKPKAESEAITSNPFEKLGLELRATGLKKVSDLPKPKKVGGNANTFRAKVSRDVPKEKNNLFQTLRTQFVDKDAPLEVLEKQVNGFVDSAEKSLYKQARLYKGSSEKAHLIVQEQLTPVIRHAQKNGYSLEDLGDYALAVHAKDVNAKGINSGFTNEEIEAVIRKFKSPAMEEARQSLLAVNNNTLDILTSGEKPVMDPAQVQAMREKWPNYMSLFRELNDDKVDFVNGLSQSLSVASSPIKKLKGSDKAVVDPMESMIKNIFKAVNVADRNNVASKLSGLAEKDTAGAFVRKLADGEEVGQIECDQCNEQG